MNLQISNDNFVNNITTICTAKVYSDSSQDTQQTVQGIVPDGWKWRVQFDATSEQHLVHGSFLLN